MNDSVVYEYIIIENMKHIWLPPPLNIGSPPSLSAYARSIMFKNYFKGYSNSILNAESWEEMKKNHTVLKIWYKDMK